ncbi:MAG: hypothetical protein K2L82_11130 [Lachnospiraceae bacterium]|nr:hypothetical protein [Lachnospiraceae bacterium]
MGKILIVAEKPAAGQDIAKVVGAATKKNGYMEGDKYIVTWAVGHLIGLKQPQEHDEKYKKWNLGNLPIFFDLSDSLKVLPYTSHQYKVIKELIHRTDIDMLINAGDAGREGYLIQEWIYRMAGCRLPKKVLWASSLTTAGIQNAMDHLKDNNLPEFQGILREAEARAEGDYLLGFNYSPLLTITRAYKQTLSYGRCQTPLLQLIYSRDKAIREFKSEPYWNVEVTYSKGFKGVLIGEDEKGKKLFDRSEAEEILKQTSGNGIVTVYEKQAKKEKAPLLYNLAKLQQDMGRRYSFSPDKTLQIAQVLYEKYKIMSYPRTDSQYLSMDVYDEIDEHLQSCSFGDFDPLVKKIDLDNIRADKSYFNDLKVTDHHALIPTINTDMESAYQQLSEDERKVFDAVVLSLIAIFYPEYQYDTTKVIVDINGNQFKSSGTTIKRLGYKILLKNNAAEKDEELQILPELHENDSLSIDSASIADKKTVPPKKYNDETIIKTMEKYNIGTSATRAEIISKLQNPKRQFIVREKGKYSVTELGEEYIRIVPEELKAPELTQQFEANLNKVNDGSMSKETFLEELLSDIRKNIAKFTSETETIPDEQKIGYRAAMNREQQTELGQCPKCGAEVKAGQYGAYCTGKCGMTFGRIRGKKLEPEQVAALLAGQKIYVTGLKKKAGGTYSAYFIPDGIEPYNFTASDGTEKEGYQFKFTIEFKQKKKRR